MSEKHLFTSESVTEGHPDKVADQISDAVVDEILNQDRDKGRVACETLVTTGMAFISAEISTSAYVDIPSVVRDVVRDIGYTIPELGFDYQTSAVVTTIEEQSQDIAMGVDVGGAGDQGMMFGYACRQTETLMPLPISMAHRLVKRAADVRKEGVLDYLMPDGKSQVTIEYLDNIPRKIDTVLMSVQHREDVSVDQIKADLGKHVIRPVISEFDIDGGDFRTMVNPTGRFVKGGPMADTGLTGRKIIVDTYGGFGSHGGGAFSGKDPTKVDRSASYAARHVAKNIVAADLADECEVQLAYAIGTLEPVSVMIDTFGTGKIADAKLSKVIRDLFDLTPGGIIGRLDLMRGIYRKTAAYGHFGREEEEFTWEKLDYVDKLRSSI
ncbi:MAG: methionine adenosyltransferase [Candidatus Latescibacteria bacterium]|nr:methionine adenosyltransferase [bacterium]MBD3424553.1 methionine adenosyltransferase [Candidatus Latescibacterota bacterium]